jgi:hypothetical protein
VAGRADIAFSLVLAGKVAAFGFVERSTLTLKLSQKIARGIASYKWLALDRI